MKKVLMAVIIISLAGLSLAGCTAEEPNEKNEPNNPRNRESILLILQAYGNGNIITNDSPAGVSHSFVELYNTTKSAIDLNGFYLYYADGERGLGITEDWAWERIALTGTIPAEGSFLILGAKHQNLSNTRYNIPDGSGDMNENFSLFRRSFKVALIEGNNELNVQNPFDINGKGKKFNGYIDMVGTANDTAHATNPDNIFGFETAPARNSASEAVRRKNLNDTNNNSVDFAAARYALDGMSDEELSVRYPRNADAGSWNPFAEPPEPPSGTPRLMILQANTYGNNNGQTGDGPYSPTGGGFARSLVELYNNTNAEINLTAGNYYLHIGSAAGWTNVIKLQGSIPSKCSFLIVSNTSPENTASNINITPRANLPTADMYANFVLVNNDFTAAVLTNQSALLSGNPFTNSVLSADYIDMLGCRNAVGIETAAASASRPQGPRRKTLEDSDNNSVDFAQVDYRGRIGNNGIDDDQLFKFWPRNSGSGEWNPITGLPAKHPTIPAN